MTAWYEHPDQKIVDDTLDERLQQMEMAQRDIRCMAPIRWESDELRAWRHLDADINVLQAKSSVPF